VWNALPSEMKDKAFRAGVLVAGASENLKRRHLSGLTDWIAHRAVCQTGITLSEIK